MKKSQAIRVSLVGAVSAAAIAAGCGSRGAANTSGSSSSWETCVDNKQNIVDQKNCDDEKRQTHSVGYVPMYRPFYYPSRLGSPILGAHLSEGTFSRPSTGTVRTGIVSGGFGSSAESVGS